MMSSRAFPAAPVHGGQGVGLGRSLGHLAVEPGEGPAGNLGQKDRRYRTDKDSVSRDVPVRRMGLPGKDMDPLPLRQRPIEYRLATKIQRREKGSGKKRPDRPVYFHDNFQGIGPLCAGRNISFPAAKSESFLRDGPDGYPYAVIITPRPGDWDGGPSLPGRDGESAAHSRYGPRAVSGSFPTVIGDVKEGGELVSGLQVPSRRGVTVVGRGRVGRNIGVDGPGMLHRSEPETVMIAFDPAGIVHIRSSPVAGEDVEKIENGHIVIGITFQPVVH